MRRKRLLTSAFCFLFSFSAFAGELIPHRIKDLDDAHNVTLSLGMVPVYDTTSSKFLPRALVEGDIANLVADLAGKQPLDSDLTAIAALATTSFGLGALEAADAAAFRTYIGAGTGSGGSSAWGDITGTLSDQPDLQDALDLKSDTTHTHAFSSLTSKPTTLSGYGITDAQPLDSDLTAVAALTTDSFGLALLTKTTAAAIRTYIGAGTSSFDGAFSSLTGKPTTLSGYGIVDAQPLDAELSAIAGLTSAANKMPYFTGSGTASLADLSAFARTFLDDADAAAVRTTLGAGTLSAITSGKTLYVDATNGNDGTALSGRADKPYLTLAAAKADASSGDMIYVYPGSYTATDNLLKNGVNWNFAPGAVVSKSTGTVGIFDDSSAGANGPVVCAILGQGQFSMSATTGVEGVLEITNSGSNVTFYGVSILQSVGSTAAVYCSAGTLHVFCSEIYQSLNGPAVWWDGNGEMFVKADLLRSNTTYAIYCSGAATTKKAWIEADLIVADDSSTNVINNIVTDAASTAWIIAKEIRKGGTSNGGKLVSSTGGKLYIFAEKAGCETNGQGIVVTGGTFWGNFQKITCPRNFLSVSGGTTYLDCLNFDSNGSNVGGGLNIVGGTAYVRGLYLNSAEDGVYAFSGSVVISGLTFNSGASNKDLHADGGSITVVGCKYNASKTTGTITQGDPILATALQPANISDTAYDATSWNGVTTITPSKNAVRDIIEALQPLDSDLTAIAALTTTSFGRGALESADAAAFRAYIGAGGGGSGAWGDITGTLSDQTDLQSALDALQPLDSDLTAIAALTTTSFGRDLLALTDAPGVLSYINAPDADDLSPLAYAATTITDRLEELSLTYFDSITGMRALSDGDSVNFIVGDNGGGVTFDNFTSITFGSGKAAIFRTALGAGTSSFDGAFSSLTGKPTTLSGYGITDAQPIDVDLTAIAGLTSAANKLPYFTGTGTASLADFTAAGRAILDDADAAAQRTTLDVPSNSDSRLSDTRTPTDNTVSTAKLVNDAVTYAKMQNVSATSRVLGRKTAGAGDTEELTLSDMLDFIGSATQGDILYRGASGWARLAADTDGKVLTTHGASADPTWTTVSGSSAVAPAVCEGRLTTETGVPISTSDRTAQSTIYFTPFNGNRISLYTSSTWTAYTFTERSLALSSLTSGKNYDVFLYDNSGTLTLELSSAWTNDTTRADALTTQDGILVKSGSTSRRYLGTIRTTGTTTTEDSGGGTTTNVGGKRFVWNYYNRTRRALAVIDTTGNWSYSTRTWRQARATTGNKVEFVSGGAANFVEGTLLGSWYGFSNSGGTAVISFGIDSTTTPSGIYSEAINFSSNAAVWAIQASYRGMIGLGYHSMAWLERAPTGGTTVFLGNDDGEQQAGMQVITEN